MEFTRGTRPDARGQTRPPAYDDYQPSVDWSQDAENHHLRVYLPDFKREQIKVQIDNSGKLMVKGMRQMDERRYMRLDKAFEVPKDTIVEKISGRFEEGCLFLTLPKKIKGEAPAPSQEKRDELSQREKPKSAEVEKKKEEEPTKREKPKSSEDGVKREEKPKSSEDGKKKEEEATQKDKPKKEEEATKKGKPKGSDDEMRKEEKPTVKDKPKVSEDGKKKEEQDTHKDKPKGSEDEMKKEEKSREVEKPKSGEDEKRKEEETTHKEKPRSSDEEEKEEEPIYTQKPKNGEEKKEREATQREKREKGEEKKKEESWYKSIVEDDYNVEKARKKAAARKKRWKDEDGWLSYGLVDDLLEKINRKRCVIAVAIVAFSVGFYVSRRMKSSGR